MPESVPTALQRFRDGVAKAIQFAQFLVAHAVLRHRRSDRHASAMHYQQVVVYNLRKNRRRISHMIITFDEGAWHPQPELLGILFILSIASLVPLARLARGARTGLGVYVSTALPLIAAFAFIAYFDFGNSGEYTGDGTLGAGAHLDVGKSLLHALPYSVYFGPGILLLGLAHLAWLRKKVRWLFWSVFALGAVLQVAFAFGFMMAWVER